MADLPGPRGGRRPGRAPHVGWQAARRSAPRSPAWCRSTRASSSLARTGDAIQWGGGRLCATDVSHRRRQGALRGVSPREVDLAPGRFILSTRRGKQFNSMVWKASDPLTGALRDDLFIDESDARALGLESGDRVLVRSETGEAAARIRFSQIRPGNVQMFFPEANPLIASGRRDPVALVPDFNATVEIIPLREGSGPMDTLGPIVSDAEPTPEASGIVLAGGRSSRFGRNKLAEPVNGVPLLHGAVRAMAAACTEVVIVATPAGMDVFMPIGLPTPIREIADPQAFAGPLVGLLTGAQAAAYELIVVAGGDMPSLDPQVLRLMLRRMQPGPGRSSSYFAAQGVALDFGGEAQRLPLVLDRAVVVAAASDLVAAGERSLGGLIAALDMAVIPETEWRTLDRDAATLQDVDRPQDLVDAQDLGSASADQVRSTGR